MVASASIIPCTVSVVCAIFSIIFSQLFDMMRAVARTGTHVRSRHFPTSPTRNPRSQAVALVRKIPTSAFSSTRAISYKLEAIVRNSIPIGAFSFPAFSQNDMNQYFRVTETRCDMRKYCCPLPAAYEKRTAAMVRNTNWTISTLTVVVLLSVLEQLLWLGSHVRGWAATSIHATCSFCSRT